MNDTCNFNFIVAALDLFFLSIHQFLEVWHNIPSQLLEIVLLSPDSLTHNNG
jgi:hypothetical protein